MSTLWLGFLYSSFLPVIIILIGLLMWKNTPKKVNVRLGYSSPFAIMNLDTYQFANQYCGHRSVIAGLIIEVVSLLVFALMYYAAYHFLDRLFVYLITGQLVAWIVSVLWSTEKALRRTFYEDGTRK